MFILENRVEYYMQNETTDQGLPYDYGSIMHYSPTCFSIKGKPTFVPLKSFSKPISPKGNASSYDYLHINLLYCQGTLTSDDKEFTLFTCLLLYTKSRKVIKAQNDVYTCISTCPYV